MSAMSDLYTEWDQATDSIESAADGLSVAVDWVLATAAGVTDMTDVTPALELAIIDAEVLLLRLRKMLPLAQTMDSCAA